MGIESTLAQPASTDATRFSEALSVPPPSRVELAELKQATIAMKPDSTANLHPVEITDDKAGAKPPTLETLASEARDSVGSNKLGNKSPAEARDLPNTKVAPGVKCAATVSTWLVEAGYMKNEDFKIRVTDPKGQGLSELLPQLGFQPVMLNGKIDASSFPEGPIGIIAGTEKFNDGTNHVGFLEKRNGELRVMHNRSGTVHDDSLVGSYFYSDNGNPRFGKMKLFVPNESALATNR